MTSECWAQLNWVNEYNCRHIVYDVTFFAAVCNKNKTEEKNSSWKEDDTKEKTRQQVKYQFDKRKWNDGVERRLRHIHKHAKCDIINLESQKETPWKNPLFIWWWSSVEKKHSITYASIQNTHTHIQPYMYTLFKEHNIR